MELTWATIVKLLVTGLITYIIFPSVLITRDYFLWKFINLFVLNKTLRDQIRSYATRKSIWNSAFSVIANFSNKNGELTYAIDGKVVSKEEWERHNKAKDKLSEMIKQNRLYITRKSVFLDGLLKHYKQDLSNPIDEWLANDIESMKDREPTESS